MLGLDRAQERQQPALQVVEVEHRVERLRARRPVVAELDVQQPGLLLADRGDAGDQLIVRLDAFQLMSFRRSPGSYSRM